MSGDAPEQFEGQDILGLTKHIQEDASTGYFNFPAASGGKPISEFIIENMSDDESLHVALDGDGTKFKTMKPGRVWIWTPKGEIKQIKIKATGVSVPFEMTYNEELC